MRFLAHAAALLLLILCLLPEKAHAATLSVGGRDGCTIQLKGELAKGDAAQLQAIEGKLTETQRQRITLCLDSPGGDYNEALAVIDHLLAGGDTETMVPENAVCASACALVFLAGSHTEEDARTPMRTLHVRAKGLEFHAPFIEVPSRYQYDKRTVENAHEAGVRAVGMLLERNDARLFPVSLLAKALQKGRDEFYSIDTINKAGRWDIALAGVRPLDVIDMKMALQACYSGDHWRNDRDSSIPQPEPPIRKGKSGKLTYYHFVGYGGEGTEDCFVAIREGAPKDVSIEFMDYADAGNPEATDAKAIERAVSGIQSLKGTYWADPQWHFLPPNTKLSALALSKLATGAAKSKPERIDMAKADVDVPKAFHIVNNRDLSGEAYKHFDTASSKICAAACSDDRQCKAFVFNTWNHMCFLKTSLGRFRFEPAAVSGYRASAGQPDAMGSGLVIQRYRKRVFPDKPYQSVRLDKEEQCADACLQRDNCLAYSYETAKKQCNFLKQAGEYTKNAGFDSGVKREVQ